MKHNHTNRRVQKSGQSAYARHGKRPYVYSENYRHWRTALADGDHAAVREGARKHSIRFLGFDATNPHERRRQDQMHAEQRRRAA